ncbi:hypothetical protein RJ639_006416 [Escallonia herrerae]|uniref:G domain-containing protein n=1 Tax=Escallonia herrerae TaxID=1293975 RepID=A0AA88VXT3_9ASTE|nr:hypothetical protein RJ639_006416 [Escallonia herrerae]
MGGDTMRSVISSTDDESSFEQELADPTFLRAEGLSQTQIGSVNAENGSIAGEYDEVGCAIGFGDQDSEANRRRAHRAYDEVLRSYDELQPRSKSLEETKSKILSWTSINLKSTRDRGMVSDEVLCIDDLQFCTLCLSFRKLHHIHWALLELDSGNMKLKKVLAVTHGPCLYFDCVSCSYTPGAWIEKVDGLELCDYSVPKTISLLLVGPKGSGKSSLVNRISRVFEDEEFTPERAQVTYNSAVGDGTYFVQEYMIPRGSKSFCLYDTRSLSDDVPENVEMLKRWLTKGVRHGDLAIMKSDSAFLKSRMKCKARQDGYCSSETRMVNFVIFVVNGLSVLKSMESNDGADKMYTEMIATMFNCPFLSFKDDKPVVVVTHGDLLSVSERSRLRVHLGERLGVPPHTQIFDIPESRDPATELTIVDMLRFSLEHADRHLPGKGWFLGKVRSFMPYLL